MALRIPGRLRVTCAKTPEGAAWLSRLSQTVASLQERWALSLGRPFDGPDVSCAWVAPVATLDGTHGVLKIAMPHMEADHEIDGLRFWNGDPTVRLLDADACLGAMLL